MFACLGPLGQRLEELTSGGVPEPLCRPTKLYRNPATLDLRKLRTLIKQGKLAPCFPGAESSTPGRDQAPYHTVVQRLLKRKHQDISKPVWEQEWEECPICCLNYPVLNTSRCCGKRVCTECFLQVQTSTPSHLVASCPFCKVPGYSAKFLGAKTLEARDEERKEEQKVIEARIREREEEVRRDQERAAQRAQQLQQQQEQQAATTAAGATAAQDGSQPATPLSAAAATAGGGVSGGEGTDSPTSAQAAGAAAREGRTGSPGQPPSSQNRSQPSPARGGGGADRSRGNTPPEAVQVVPLSQVDARTLALAQQQLANQPFYSHQPTSSVQGIPDQPPTNGTTPAGRIRAQAAAAAAGAGGRSPGTAPAAREAGPTPQAARGGQGRSREQPTHRVSAGGRRYRLADYVPTAVADISVNVEDINDYMLEQAMYESLAAAAAATNGRSGGGGEAGEGGNNSGTRSGAEGTPGRAGRQGATAQRGRGGGDSTAGGRGTTTHIHRRGPSAGIGQGPAALLPGQVERSVHSGGQVVLPREAVPAVSRSAGGASPASGAGTRRGPSAGAMAGAAIRSAAAAAAAQKEQATRSRSQPRAAAQSSSAGGAGNRGAQSSGLASLAQARDSSLAPKATSAGGAGHRAQPGADARRADAAEARGPPRNPGGFLLEAPAGDRTSAAPPTGNRTAPPAPVPPGGGTRGGPPSMESSSASHLLLRSRSDLGAVSTEGHMSQGSLAVAAGTAGPHRLTEAAAAALAVGVLVRRNSGSAGATAASSPTATSMAGRESLGGSLTSNPQHAVADSRVSAGQQQHSRSPVLRSALAAAGSVAVGTGGEAGQTGSLATVSSRSPPAAAGQAQLTSPTAASSLAQRGHQLRQMSEEEQLALAIQLSLADMPGSPSSPSAASVGTGGGFVRSPAAPPLGGSSGGASGGVTVPRPNLTTPAMETVGGSGPRQIGSGSIRRGASLSGSPDTHQAAGVPPLQQRASTAAANAIRSAGGARGAFSQQSQTLAASIVSNTGTNNSNNGGSTARGAARGLSLSPKPSVAAGSGAAAAASSPQGQGGAAAGSTSIRRLQTSDVLVLSSSSDSDSDREGGAKSRAGADAGRGTKQQHQQQSKAAQSRGDGSDDDEEDDESALVSTRVPGGGNTLMATAAAKAAAASPANSPRAAHQAGSGTPAFVIGSSSASGSPAGSGSERAGGVGGGLRRPSSKAVSSSYDGPGITMTATAATTSPAGSSRPATAAGGGGVFPSPRLTTPSRNAGEQPMRRASDYVGSGDALLAPPGHDGAIISPDPLSAIPGPILLSSPDATGSLKPGTPVSSSLSTAVSGSASGYPASSGARQQPVRPESTPPVLQRQPSNGPHLTSSGRAPSVNLEGLKLPPTPSGPSPTGKEGGGNTGSHPSPITPVSPMLPLLPPVKKAPAPPQAPVPMIAQATPRVRRSTGGGSPAGQAVSGSGALAVPASLPPLVTSPSGSGAGLAGIASNGSSPKQAHQSYSGNRSALSLSGAPPGNATTSTTPAADKSAPLVRLGSSSEVAPDTLRPTSAVLPASGVLLGEAVAESVMVTAEPRLSPAGHTHAAGLTGALPPPRTSASGAAARHGVRGGNITSVRQQGVAGGIELDSVLGASAGSLAARLGYGLSTLTIPSSPGNHAQQQPSGLISPEPAPGGGRRHTHTGSNASSSILVLSPPGVNGSNSGGVAANALDTVDVDPIAAAEALFGGLSSGPSSPQHHLLPPLRRSAAGTGAGVLQIGRSTSSRTSAPAIESEGSARMRGGSVLPFKGMAVANNPIYNLSPPSSQNNSMSLDQHPWVSHQQSLSSQSHQGHEGTGDRGSDTWGAGRPSTSARSAQHANNTSNNGTAPVSPQLSRLGRGSSMGRTSHQHQQPLPTGPGPVAESTEHQGPGHMSYTHLLAAAAAESPKAPRDTVAGHPAHAQPYAVAIPAGTAVVENPDGSVALVVLESSQPAAAADSGLQADGTGSRADALAAWDAQLEAEAAAVGSSGYGDYDVSYESESVVTSHTRDDSAQQVPVPAPAYSSQPVQGESEAEDQRLQAAIQAHDAQVVAQTREADEALLRVATVCVLPLMRNSQTQRPW